MAGKLIICPRIDAADPEKLNALNAKSGQGRGQEA